MNSARASGGGPGGAPPHGVERGIGRSSSSTSASSSTAWSSSSSMSVGSHQKPKKSEVTTRAPDSAASMPAPPKWSGCEWVTMTVCTRSSGMPASVHALAQDLPVRLTRQPGVDEREAVAVLEGVGVHVAEAREVDRELEPQDGRRDLEDLLGCVFLLLLVGVPVPLAARWGRRVRRCRGHGPRAYLTTRSSPPATPEPVRTADAGGAGSPGAEQRLAVEAQLVEALADVVDGPVALALAGLALQRLRGTSAWPAP